MRDSTSSALALVAAALVLGGCGYRLAGSGGVLPPHIRDIAVRPFENLTTRPEIEQRVTEDVSRELSRRRRYSVVTDASRADAVLDGAITGYHTRPVQFGEEGRQTQVEAVVTLRATLREVATDRVLWSQAGLIFRGQFEVSDTGAEFFDEETLALDEIARGAAGVVVTSILEGGF
jgi:TolB-like protein